MVRKPSCKLALSQAANKLVESLVSLKAIGISRATLGDLVERYQHRILTLELDLRQMGREDAINNAQYKKRILLLKELRLNIQLLE
ncbi:MAG: hypothetical protein HRU09_13180 [Oligoflexales bacterium]|nr:hypothetical protein [Oligoflexales bacterium]